MNAIVKINEELEVEVVVDPKHEWLLATKDVAEGYGLTVNAINMSKSRNSDELIEGKHFVTYTTDGGRPSAMWTKRGVARLGFFIKTPMAREFRDWAEDFIIEGGQKVSTPVIPQSFAEALMLAAKQAQAIELMTPKVQTYEAIMSTSSASRMTDAATVVGIKPQQLQAFLLHKGYLYRSGAKAYHVYQQYVKQGLFTNKLVEYRKDSSSNQVCITPKGIELLHTLVAEYDKFHFETKNTTGMAV